MSIFFKALLSTVLLLTLAPAPTPAGIEPDNTCDVLIAYEGPETLTLMVRPDGAGPAFDQARTPWGGLADATVTLILRDGNYYPIESYPAEDLWLESLGGGLALCPAGTIADAATDVDGITRWTRPPAAGGYSTTETVVMANGAPVWALDPRVPLNFNSPDINGDLVVNLSDLQIFTAEYFLTQGFRADFHRDGVVDLSDLAQFAYAFGGVCP